MRRPNHYFTIRGYKICARCLGLLIAYLVTMPLFRFFSPDIDTIMILTPSLILASICFANWIAGKFYVISNKSRFISGILLGVGISYFTLLPDRRIVAVHILSIVLILMVSILLIRRRMIKMDEYQVAVPKEHADKVRIIKDDSMGEHVVYIFPLDYVLTREKKV